MNASTLFRTLKEFDLADLDLAALDLDDFGNWPSWAKALAMTLLYSVTMATGFYLHIENRHQQLANVERSEQELRQSFEAKAFEAANLYRYKAQLVEMETRFGVLVSQLPSQTEVPGLLEDITSKGELNGLRIKRIDLLDEQTQNFYIELPIAIEATGSYHDLGAFISGMASLPRIVTLHDFQILGDAGTAPILEMKILAKTYRYREDDDAG
jgi:type IV pilus assembly protein PilO